jgi:uncharacterized protein with PIN domain
MIDLKEKMDVTPLCPHCNEAITQIWFRELRSTFGRRYVYFCEHCKKVFGMTHRKGFFMG